MKKRELILILGGARAGKSTFALRLATDLSENVCFIATAEAMDKEMQSRIEVHKAERPENWTTIEEPRELDAALRDASYAEVVIVDCLTLFVSNWMMAESEPAKMNAALARVFDAFFARVAGRKQTVILVSNEVGFGIVPDNELGRVFRDALGRVNQVAAAAADRVYLLVAGLPIQLKPGRTL